MIIIVEKIFECQLLISKISIYSAIQRVATFIDASKFYFHLLLFDFCRDNLCIKTFYCKLGNNAATATMPDTLISWLPSDMYQNFSPH